MFDTGNVVADVVLTSALMLIVVAYIAAGLLIARVWGITNGALDETGLRHRVAGAHRTIGLRRFLSASLTMPVIGASYAFALFRGVDYAFVVGVLAALTGQMVRLGRFRPKEAVAFLRAAQGRMGAPPPGTGEIRVSIGSPEEPIRMSREDAQAIMKMSDQRVMVETCDDPNCPVHGNRDVDADALIAEEEIPPVEKLVPDCGDPTCPVHRQTSDDRTLADEVGDFDASRRAQDEFVAAALAVADAAEAPEAELRARTQRLKASLTCQVRAVHALSAAFTENLTKQKRAAEDVVP